MVVAEEDSAATVGTAARQPDASWRTKQPQQPVVKGEPPCIVARLHGCLFLEEEKAAFVSERTDRMKAVFSIFISCVMFTQLTFVIDGEI